MMRTTAVGERIRRLRQARGWSQYALAVRAGLVEGAVRHLESGRNRDPKLSTLRALASAFGLTLAALLADNGDLDAA